MMQETTTEGSIFSTLDAVLASQGADAVLEQLDAYLLAEKRYHELFEIEKMRVRRGLDLPIVPQPNEVLATSDLDEDSVRLRLEQGLLEACRRIGLLLISDGRLRESWHYLRAVGDESLVEEQLENFEPTEQNLDEFLELAIQEGFDLQRGFQLMLDHYGVCNTITAFDSSMYGQPRHRRAIGAALLVAHVHDELKENVRAHIERQEGVAPEVAPLSQWIASRDWLFEGGTYHLDTTHLASVVNFARDLDSPAHLEQAMELAKYGARLDAQLQYPGDPPFDPLYETSLRYFRALLGEDILDQLDFFRQKAEAVRPREETTMGIEVYIELLSRVGKSDLAIEESIRLLPEDVQQTGRAPSLLELADACGHYDAIKHVARKRNDPLGYAVGMLRHAGL